MASENQLEMALCAHDERRRPERIRRIVWLSEHENLPSIIMGRAETLRLLNEAREVFVDGHNVAALMLTVSVINHALIEELQLRDAIKGDPGLAKVLAKSEELKILPAEWFSSIKQLVNRRHPFAHFKEIDHEHGLSERIRREEIHPSSLLEQDAREAIFFMFRVFRATLRETTM